MMQNERLIKISFDNVLDNIVNEIIKKYDKSMGGRGVISELETLFIDELSLYLFQNNELILENKKEGKYTNIETFYTNSLTFKIS